MRSVLVTLRTAMAEAWANRGAFWLQVTIMVVNDTAWVAFWLLFFDRVGEIRGWDASGVLLLFAILTTAAGLALGVLGNARHVGRLAADGELDAVLALPVPPLAYLLVRRIETVNLGDALFGIALFALAGEPTVERTAIYVGGVLVGSVLLAGFLVAAGSLAFFVGRSEAGELGLHSILLFAGYPADLFGGPTKALLYTVLPAAFVAAVPARLVESFDPGRALALGGVAVGFALLGWITFTLGLRRYTSGSLWTRA